ncbi:MAG TPA: elongation factor G [bacterium]
MATKGIRNIGFFGHAGCGKTTIADAILYLTGANTRFGKVSEGTSVFDTEPEELKRGCSLNLGLATLAYRDFTFNIVDTPGYSDFMGEALSGIEAIDSAVIVVDGVDGIAVGTERYLHEVERKNLPCLFFVNKLKKENSDFFAVFEGLKDITKRRIIPMTIPVGSAEKTQGIADVFLNKIYTFQDGKPVEGAAPADIASKLEKYRDLAVEIAADFDEAIMNKYVEGSKVTLEECIPAIKKGIAQNQISLCLAADALELIGITNLIDALIEHYPSAEAMPDFTIGSQSLKRSDDAPFVGYIFKTAVEPHLGELCYLRVHSGKVQVGETVTNATKESTEKINQILVLKGKERKETNVLPSGMIGALVKLKDTHTGDTLAVKVNGKLPAIKFPLPSISMAIIPKAKGDEEKISTCLNKLRNEDPTFNFAYDPEIKQLIISGIGELHLDTILARLQRKYSVSVDLAKPRIKYRETFTRKTEAQGKYKKQTGGHGQYGDCWLRIEPLGRGQGFEFEDAITQGRIPGRYVPSVEKGVREFLEQGFLAGYPVADIKVSVYDGSYHEVDSSDIAFKIAASMAMKANAEKGDVVLLEPISEVEVYVPEKFMGDVIGDLNSRRGKIMGMEAVGKNQMIKAIVPEAEMYKYSTSLRSMTQGRGYFIMKFHHYEEVPKEITKKIVEESKREAK